MNTALGTFRLFGFYRILFKEKNGRKVNGRAEKYAAGPDEGPDICSDEIKRAGDASWCHIGTARRAGRSFK